jgi:cell wall-associated NlpC family hydrolase
MKIVIRPDYLHLDREKLIVSTKEMRSSVYKTGATDVEAPWKSDCITAVRYILKMSTDFLLPKSYIWDLPRLLISLGAREISLSWACMGDLVFFERMSFTHKKYMISHVGIMISEKDFYHSSLHYGGGKISSLEDIDYNSLVLDESFLDIAYDPRSIWKISTS